MLLVDLGGRLCFLRELRSSLALRAPPQDSSCIAERMNRASSRDEAGTSVFLSISDLDCRVSAELEQESQASSCDEVGTLLDSTVVHGTHLRMRPVSRGNSRRAPWVVPHAERPRFPSPFWIRTRCPDTSSKATLWVKLPFEGALTPPCVVRKNPRFPHTA